MGLGFMLIIAKIIIFFQSLSMSNTLAHALRTFGVMMPEFPPLPTEIPDYILCRRERPSYYPRPKKEPKDTAAVYLHPNLEEALKAAKRGARSSSGRWFGRENGGEGFCVYEGGKVVERHITKKGAGTG